MMNPFMADKISFFLEDGGEDKKLVGRDPGDSLCALITPSVGGGVSLASARLTSPPRLIDGATSRNSSGRRRENTPFLFR